MCLYCRVKSFIHNIHISTLTFRVPAAFSPGENVSPGSAPNPPLNCKRLVFVPRYFRYRQCKHTRSTWKKTVITCKEVIKVVQPVFLGKMIIYFETYDPEDMAALYETLGYAAGLSVCSIGLALLHHLYFYHVQRTGMKIRVAMCHMIYNKALCLSSSAMDHHHGPDRQPPFQRRQQV
ncbi:hypothetical protein NQZ68_002682 [Dissostichus eleginoides]|nr:hypothetical protein NQZ68_002682 [Dissostichus eleginoides]